MAQVTYLKQILHVHKVEHEEYLREFPEEPMYFFDYVNVMLGSLSDDGHRVLEIQIIDLDNVIIFYEMKIQ